MSQDCDISAEKTPKFLCFRDIPVRFGRYNKDNEKERTVFGEPFRRKRRVCRYCGNIW